MVAVLQRITHACVEVDGNIIGKAERGLLVLVGFFDGDTEEDLSLLVSKITALRIFEDENEKMNFSVSDIGGDILSIPNFTLAASCRKGRRPDFSSAMKPALAAEYYDRFNKMLLAEGVHTETGSFGADMKISSVADGPVTIILDSDKLKLTRRGSKNDET